MVIYNNYHIAIYYMTDLITIWYNLSNVSQISRALQVIMMFYNMLSGMWHITIPLSPDRAISQFWVAFVTKVLCEANIKPPPNLIPLLL